MKERRSKELDEGLLNLWHTELIDGEISEKSRARLQVHLDQRPELRIQLEEARQARALLQSLTHPAPPAMLADKALRRMKRRRRQSRRGPLRVERFPIEFPTLVSLILLAMSWLMLSLHQRALRQRVTHYLEQGSAPEESHSESTESLLEEGGAQ